MHPAQSALLLGAAALAVATAAAAAPDGELDQVKEELARTRSELDATRAALQALTEKVEKLETGGAAAAAPAPPGPRIAPVNADNPAISFVVDAEALSDTGDHGNGADFQLRSGELFISAPVDPFLRAFATLNGSSESGFDIEEAALVTTALPGNLTVKGGRFFADVGRLPHWHDEALPFANRPPSIDRIIGGESRAEGVEVSWLVPIEHYVNVTAGVYDGIGADPADQRFDVGKRSFSELTWLVHPSTYFDLTDTLNLEVGGTYAVMPHAQSAHALYAVDATLRHQPGTSGFYQGLAIGTEWLWNSERFDDIQVGVDPDTGAPLLGSRRFNRNGGYGYVEAFFGRRYSAGLRADYSEDVSGPADRLRTYSAFATWMPSEFQRLRFQVDHEDGAGEPNDVFTLEWTAFMGSHSHGFATR